MFVFGMILGLPGTILGQAATVEQFGLSFADRGLLIAALFTGLLLGSLLSGPVVDRIGTRSALLASSAFVALCLPLLAAASNAPFAAAALGAIGLASASMNTASNALSSDLFPEERGRRMNGIAVMVGLGGLFMPAATVLAAEWLSWRIVVIAGAVLSAMVAVASARLEAGDQPRPARGPLLAAARGFARQPAFAWFCLLILLGGGSEASMAGWTTTLLSTSGFSAAEATWVLSSHWLGLILSRAAFSRRVDRAKATVVERCAALSAVLVFFLVASATPAALAGGPFVVGMSMALVMPTSLALAGEQLRGNAGTLFGMLLTLAQVGGMVLPASIGLVAEQGGVRLGLGLLVASFGAIARIARHLGTPEGGHRDTPKGE
jgi:fucose permease